MLLCQSVWAQTALSYHITGLKYDAALENAKARLDIDIQHAGEHPSQIAIHHIYKQADQTILDAIKPFGYFKAKVTSDLKKQGNHWHAQFHVIPGPVLKVANVDIKITGFGENNPAFIALKQHLPIKPKDPLNVQAYKKLKRQLFNTAREQGYITSHLSKQTLEIDLVHYEANIILHFNTGERFYFGKTQFNKNYLNDRFLAKFLPYKPGDPFSSNTIAQTQRNLSDSGYFKSVIVTPDREAANHQQVPVDVHLVLKDSQSYHLGAGYGTDTGIRGLLGWDLNNITPGGQHFSALLHASFVQNTLQGTYYIPGRDPLKQRYTFSAGLQNEDINGRSLTGNLTTGYVFNTDQWQRNIRLSYQIERFAVEGDPSSTSHLLMPSFNLSHINADHTILATNGNRFDAIFKGATSAVASTVSFFQVDLQDKFIRTFFDDNRLILRGEYGYTTVSNLARFPLSQRFFTGGSQSVRGFGYKQLGPGRYLLTGSSELQRRVYNQWYAVGFVDTGNAFDNFGQPLFDLLKTGVGGGVMYASAIGPIELTLAHSLNPGFRSYAIQFVMGPDL